MCKSLEGIGAKLVPVGEGEVTFLPPSKIELNVKENGFKLKAEGYSEDFLLQLVDKLKAQHNVDSQVVHKPVMEATKVLNESIKPVPPVEAPKPVYSTEGTSNSSLAEKFGDKAKEMYAKAGVTHEVSDNDYFHTGIKYDDFNRPKYRCAYECPKCGASGRHYIPMHISRVSCHQCNTPLVVDSATELGKGTTDEHRDSNGNFLFAEVIDYTVQA